MTTSRRAPMPPRRSALLTLATGALLATACASSTGDTGTPAAGTETPPTLASGATLARDPGSTPLGNSNKARVFGVVDVARLGNTVAVLLVDQVTGLTGSSPNPNCPLTCPPVTSNTNSFSFQILVSPDLGATWGAPLPVPAWPSPTVLSPAPMPSGILLGGLSTALRAYVVHDYSSPSPLASPIAQRTVRELNLGTGRYVANVALDDVLLSSGFGQRGATPAGFDSFTGGTAPGLYNATLTWDSVALSAATITHRVQATSTVYRYPDIWTSSNGATWVTAQPEGTQVCIYRVTPSGSMTPSRTCWGDSLFPPEIGSPTASLEVVETTRGPMLCANRPASNGHVVAALIDSTPVALDLGAINPPRRDPGVHARYGGLVLGNSLAASSALDITSTGVDQLSFPATPCSTSTCGSDQVQLGWLLGLPGGDLLAFYVVETGAFSEGLYGTQTTSHPLLVTRRVTPARAAYGAGPPSLAARPAPSLMNACTVMSSCFGTARQACVNVFQVSSLTAPNRNQLLTSYTSGCATLAPLWPDASLPGRSGCVPGCNGNVAVTCSGSTVATATDCSRTHATCGVTAGTGTLACGDGSATLSCGTCSANGGAVTCDRPVPTVTGCAALGRSCQVTTTGPLCPIPTACTNEVSCSGDTLTRCVEGSFRTTDCAEHGQTCTTANGGACVSASPYPACAAGTFTEACDGTRALYCSGGTLLASDCAVLGFGRCTVVGGEARCAP